MRAEDIRLSFTNPIYGEAPRQRRYQELQYVEIGGVVLQVHHFHRSRSPLWIAKPYQDHLHRDAFKDWPVRVEQMSGVQFAHIRRRALREQIAAAVGTEEWERGRAVWLSLPRQPEMRGTYRVVRRGPRDWWAVPNDPTRDEEQGPFGSERAVRAGVSGTVG
ncbi:hypothetical protein ACIP9H_33370 [Streptomyces sp. NPDC088732]|uniref:hypothetical protein n=1 Tax=Streptomyces sp. NPDC088732 TaxID=3365879 RepID=UPI003806CE1D